MSGPTIRISAEAVTRTVPLSDDYFVIDSLSTNTARILASNFLTSGGGVPWSTVTGAPTSAAGYGILNGSVVDSWGTKAVPAGVVADLSSAQTLTNKTLTSPTLNSANLVTPAIGVASGTSLSLSGTTSSTTSLTGTVLIGNGVAATNVGIGGGNVRAGGIVSAASITATGTITANGTLSAFNASISAQANGATALTLSNSANPAANHIGLVQLSVPGTGSIPLSTEYTLVSQVTGTMNWTTGGTVPLQRGWFIDGPTYGSSGTTTMTDVFNGFWTPPIPGTGMTFTRGHTLGVLDSTSASSSITGAVIIAATLGTAATSIGLGGGNGVFGGNVTASTLVSTVATGTAPFTVTSTTTVANLNAASVQGATMAAPGAIGGTTPAAGAFTTLTASTSVVVTEAIIATSTDGLVSSNTAAATSGVLAQWSPRIRLSGTAWNTTSVASQTNDWIVENKTTSGATTFGTLSFSSQSAGGGYVQAMGLFCTAATTILTIGSTSGQIGFSNAGTINANGGSLTLTAQTSMSFATSIGTTALTLDTSQNATFTGGIILPKTNAGSTGAQTINKASGTVQFAAAATSLVVTNSLCGLNSVITCQLATNDATAVLGAVVPGVGSFTIFMKTAPTGTSVVAFRLTN